MLIPQLQTQRLILPTFTKSNLDACAEMCINPVAMRYIGTEKPLSCRES